MRTPRGTTPGALAALLLLASCSSADPSDAVASGTTSSIGTTPAATRTAATTTAGSPTSGTPTVSTTRSAPAPTEVAGTDVLATDLPTPWGLARLPDGSHLVSLRDEARVVHITPAGEVSRVPATGAGGRVAGVEPSGEGGLLGLVLDPRDPQTLYAYLTSASDNRLVRMRYSGGRLGAPTALLTGIPKAGNHNGGRLAFGPDGYLYVTTGDAGQTGRSQDRSSLGGKILRVTREGRPAAGNPFAGSPVWTYGHRNVQGLGWADDGRMYASEFGQNTFDELNLIEPGKNYGWPTVEGMGTARDVARGFTAPLRVWATSEASPSGLAVGLGSVWMAALRGERLWRVPLTGQGRVGQPDALLGGELGRLRSVEVQPDGTLLLLTDNFSRGSGRSDDDRLVRVRLR